MPKILNPPKSGALGLSLFTLMVNPRLSVALLVMLQNDALETKTKM